jgi:N-sulfoglucosamine sulfohydrolase
MNHVSAWMKFVRLLLFLVVAGSLHAADTRPNIVWIFGEDMGPELGCYGDKQAITPSMDRLAREGALYTHCYTHAPVCAPSRSGLITGQYPTTIGTHHMRSQLLNPPPMFTDYLKKAGYTICWPTKSGFGKTDFNFEVPKNAFDVRTDWTEKKPQQPFFGFFNITWSHESKIRADKETFARLTEKLRPNERHDPNKMEVPPYHPDAPEVRRDLANYYDLVTAVDKKMGDVLDTLEKWGIASNTVIILTGDHGRGLPRSKRWVYDSGIHVPLIVRWPGQIKPGTVRDDLVSFIDFAPTSMSLAGVPRPPIHDSPLPVPGGHKNAEPLYPPLQGIAFLGENAQKRDYIFAARDRMDETYDRIRAVRDKQFEYIRNFEPQLPYAQRIAYNEEMPTMQVWRKWNAEWKLNDTQKIFFAPTKPKEELYDCKFDPYEIHNLADNPKYGKKLKELRGELDKWVEQTHDMGAIPEKELIKRGLVADRLSGYDARKLKPENKNE